MTGRPVGRWRSRGGELAFNVLLTHLPLRWLRLAALRAAGARVGPDSTLFRGTTVLAPENLVIGRECGIGFRCMLDARGGLTIGDRVVIASDVHVITAEHDVTSPAFESRMAPVHIEDYVWLASRATLLAGVTVGRGGVVAAGAVVRESVEPHQIVGGVPAVPIGERVRELDYRPVWHPLGY